jgi:hypothetical protein
MPRLSAGFPFVFCPGSFSRLGSIAGGRLLFLEFFLTNLDSTIWQTVINSSIADLKDGLIFFSLLSCSLTFAMAASISISWFVISLSLPLFLLL